MNVHCLRISSHCKTLRNEKKVKMLLNLMGLPPADFKSQQSQSCLNLFGFFWQQLAAHYLREKRYFHDLALSGSEISEHHLGADSILSSAESVAPSIYVGQFARLLDQSDTYSMQV